MLPLLRCFFAHLLILQYPDYHQNLISSSLYYSGPVHKISSQSVRNFLSNVVHRQTDRQTDRQTNQRYQKHNLLCQGGNKQINAITHQSRDVHQQKDIWWTVSLRPPVSGTAYTCHPRRHMSGTEHWTYITVRIHQWNVQLSHQW